MKVGDLVRYSEKSVEMNIGMVVGTDREYGTCEILWDDGEVWTHDADEFGVINGECETTGRL